MNGSLASAVRELRRAARWHRRLLAAGLAAAAVAVALTALKPAPPVLVPVVVAAHDLGGGATLLSRDVSRRMEPASAVPDGALAAPTAAVGRVLASPVRSGEPLTDVRLLGSVLLGSLRAGQVAAPVRVADASAVSLVRPGTLVDILAAKPGDDGAQRGAGATVVAAAARVIAVPVASDATTASEGALVVLAVDDATAIDLARAAVNARLSVLLRPG